MGCEYGVTTVLGEYWRLCLWELPLRRKGAMARPGLNQQSGRGLRSVLLNAGAFTLCGTV